ncbi:MAG: arylesterase [Pseudomonadota bacterium]
MSKAAEVWNAVRPARRSACARKSTDLIALAWALLAYLLAAAAPAGERAIVVVGDSLSAAYGLRAEQGWVHLLDRRVRAAGHAYQVVNASISGDTSRGGSARIGILLKRFEVAVAVVELGGNDGLRGIQLANTRRHLAEMIAAFKAAGAKVLLVGMQIPPNLGPRYTRDFKAMYPALATEYDVALVPFLLEGVATDPALMQRDGIHPTAAAQPLILENVWPHLKPML